MTATRPKVGGKAADRPMRPAVTMGRATLERRLSEILVRHPAVGLAVGVVHSGDHQFVCHGYADLLGKRPITERTVFRIGSITKTMTAIAVMQLVEAGLIDLDRPAIEYLHSYRLVLRDPAFSQPTVRHLLTHTAGIPDARRLTDLLHFGWGPWDGRPPTFSVPIGETLPPLGDYYRDGLEVVAEPGSTFAYSNPGFATLGQLVEDVSGVPLARYLRERIFAPLGMADTDLHRSPAVETLLATGYTVRRDGPRPVPDRDWIGAGGGGAYSTLADLGAFAQALLHGGANEHGRVLAPESLGQMFNRHFQNAPGLAAMGLAFFRTDIDGHRVVSHDGILPGFNAHLAVAPEDGVAVIALTNGSSGAMRWLPAEMEDVLRDLLDLPRDLEGAETPHHPEIWGEICGRYTLPPPGDLRGRLAIGGGLQVFVAADRPTLRVRLPVPALWRGIPLQPADASDPRAFRLDLSPLGMGQVHLRFAVDPVTGRRLMHTDLGGQPITFVEPSPRRLAAAKVDRLGGEDQLMLLMSRRWPQDIGALAMLDGAQLFDAEGRFRLGAVRRHVASRLHLVPRLRQVIRSPHWGRGGPYWADAQAFDLRRHVQEIRLAPGSGEAELLATVESLRAQRFERRHPLWRMWFITGQPDRTVAMFVKLHHTIGDGLAAMTIITAFLDAAPDVAAVPVQPWVPRPAPRPSQLVADNLRGRLAVIGRTVALLGRPRLLIRTLRTELPAVRELLAEKPGDRTSIDRIVGEHRDLALVRSSYRGVRGVGRASGATVNDVLLAATGAGVRRLLMSRHEPVDGVTIRTYVPVSLRHRLRGPQQGNELAQMAVPLALGEAAPRDRLHEIAGETGRRKARRRPAIGSLFRGRLISKLLIKFVVAQRVNVTTASIPGPRRPMYFAGASVLEVFPVLPLVGNEPIGVGAVSYANTFNVGIAVDHDAVPDVASLAAGVRDELAALTELR